MAASLTSALDDAITKSTRPLSRDLRRSSLLSGWGRGETTGLRVVAKGRRLSVVAPDKALGREYGDHQTPPDATIRRWANRSSRIEGILIQSAERVLKKEGIL